MNIDHQGSTLGAVLGDIARQSGAEIYLHDARCLNEPLTVSLRDISWREAVDVVSRMVIHLAYFDRDDRRAFVDYACTNVSETPPQEWLDRNAHRVR